MVHFFDIHYANGLDWYRQFYSSYAGEAMIGDTTVSYIRDPFVPKRIAEYDSNAKLIFSLRNPIDRAFSHYWHEKKKHKIAFEFKEVFVNYDLYQSWIVPGFYYRHLMRFYEYFPNTQILIILVDDILNDPATTIRQVFTFLDVAPNFAPSVLYKQVNKAWYQPVGPYHLKKLQVVLAKLIRSFVPEQTRTSVIDRYFRGNSPGKIRSEYERGMDKMIRAQLREIFQPENEKLQQLLDRDLSLWQ